MERGLFWSVLLIVFCWLTWSGWNEYQKVQVYEKWAANFDKSKYDIYAVLGLKNKEITWGKPTRKGITNLETFSLTNLISLNLLINQKLVKLDNLPQKGKSEIEFNLSDKKINIPFTDIDLAVKWFDYLNKLLVK
jgi:hypothetical protein